jgi:hypothetical protein
MVLHGGRVRFLGDKRQGIAMYYELVGASQPTAAPERSKDDSRTQVSRSASLDANDFASFPWQPPDRTDQVGNGNLDITGVCYRDEDGAFTQCVRRGEWIEVLVRYSAAADVGPINCGLEVHDRFGQLLFAVNWLNAEIEPLDVKAGDVFYSRFRIQVEVEPGEYTLWLGASEAARDAQSHTGWDQHVGGERYVGLPRAGKIAVMPRKDRRRSSFGPANLAYEVDRTAPEAVNRGQ